MNIKRIYTNLAIILIPFLITVLIEYIHKGSINSLIDWISNEYHLFLYTYLIIFAFMNIFILIRSKRILIIIASFIGLLISLLAYVSNIKMDLRGEPLSLLDYKLVSEALTVSDGFVFNLLIPALLVGIFFVIAIISFLKVKGKIDIPEVAIYLVLSIVILVITFKSSIGDLAKFNISVPADTAFNHEENGFVLASVIDTKFMFVPQPQNYSNKTIKNIVKEIKQYGQQLKTDDGFKNPNIIFVMSESFSDPTVLLNVNINKDVIPNFRSIGNEYTSGKITVPGIGGGTANTEFEVLTGFSKNNIPNYSSPYNPYNTYINNNIDSLASEFSQNNYKTLAIHSYYSWFYRRNSVYKMLGFEQFIPLEFMDQKKSSGRFLDDSVVNDLIIKQVNQTKEKDFIFAVTMNSHGPYDIEREKSIIVDDSRNTNPELENYLNAIHLSDQRLGELISYFEDFDEPTVIVFFGDHIPPLGNEIYNNFNVEMGSVASKSAPFVIWSNYYKNPSKNLLVDASLLGSLVLDEIGYRNNDYFNYLSQLITDEPINEKIKNNLYNLQYDILHGNRYYYSYKNEFKNDDYQLGTKFSLNSISAKRFDKFIALEITGKGFLPNLKLKIKNEIFPIQFANENKIYSYIPIKYLNKKEEVELVVIDSRETIIKNSNKLNMVDIKFIDDGTLFENWISADLNENQYWELFDEKEDYVIVRLQLNEHPLNDERPYFVEKEGMKLEDKNADYIDNSFYSDIYDNGYLYISVPKNNILSHVDINQIKKYFSQENYVLKILNNK